MDDLLQFVPEEKREEFKTVASAYIKADVEEIKRNTSLFDKLVDGPLRKREQNLRELEFPKLLEAEREKIRKELNPEETPKDREIRELKEWKAKMEAEASIFSRKEELRGKYQSVNPELAALLYPLEDGAIEAVMKTIDTLKNEADFNRKRDKFGNPNPPAGGGQGGLDLSKMSTTQVMEYAKQGPEQKAAVLEWQRTSKRPAY